MSKFIDKSEAQTSNIMQEPTTPLISTRNHFNFRTGVLIPKHSSTSYDALNIPGLQIESFPSEVVIYIHGFWRDEIDAEEEFDRIQISLTHNNYKNPLIGFSWDSKTHWDIKKAWDNAKTIAEDNGPKLAQFIIDFKNKCPNTNIRLIAHSLGAAIVDSTLVNLDKNEDWKSSSYSKIKSVHLLGAAISNKLIAKNTPFGKAIDHVVDKFYNLYNPKDNGLKSNKQEKHDPLGLVGKLPKKSRPLNYNERDVIYEILPFPDADGNGLLDCFEDCDKLKIREWGENHCGYIGFRKSLLRTFLDDGAMNVVVENWITS
jgi:hypothetical protein